MALAMSVSYAQDSYIELSHTVVLFDAIPTAQESSVATVSVRNLGYSSGIGIGTIGMEQSHSSSFAMSGDNCSGISLAKDSSCSFGVKFIPQSSGIKSAIVNIPYGDNHTLNLMLTNHENKTHEAKRRIAPIVTSLDMPSEMNATTTYTLGYAITGYHDSYETTIAIFDCSGTTGGECGASLQSSSKIYESTQTHTNTAKGIYSYRDIDSTEFSYSCSFTPPATRADGSAWQAQGTPIVVRLYVKSDEDISAQKRSLSLIIPHGLAKDHYDASGRKVELSICPNTGCIKPER
jgi:hypothetical protein